MTSPSTIHFNTGRLYTVHGQRITATYHPSTEIITFRDHSRGIVGEIPRNPSFTRLSIPFRPSEVLFDYDHNRYQSTPRAYEDGFLPGGPNLIYKPDQEQSLL